MMLTRGYANDNNMSWAPPDLMQMGRPALQAIKESGLKGDGYQALRKTSGLNQSNDSILAGAGYMQRRHLNGNEAAKAGAAVYEHPSMTPASKKEWQHVVDRKNYPEGPAGDTAYANAIRESATRGKEQRPEMTPEYDRALKAYGADKDAGLDAKAGANKSEAGATKDGAEAKKQDTSAQQKSTAADAKDAKADAKDAKNDEASAKMAELLKKRQAAASSPKPNG